MGNKIAIIRIKGMVEVRREFAEAMYRLRLRRKFSCVVVEPTPEILGMLQKIKNFVAYGEISDEVYKELNEKRKSNIENFFRLHPPRKGIKSKLSFNEGGVLGDNKDKINDLIRRML